MAAPTRVRGEGSVLEREPEFFVDAGPDAPVSRGALVGSLVVVVVVVWMLMSLLWGLAAG